MAKKKGKKKKVEKNNAEINLRITEDVLVQAIVKTNRMIREEQEKQEQIQKQKEHEEWLKVLKQKECKADANFIQRKWNTCRNSVFALFIFLFIKRKYVRDARTTVALMSMMTALVFGVCEWLLYIGSLFLLWVASKETESVLIIINHVIEAIIVWLIARLFRVASIEIEKMKDYNLLITIFSAIMSFLAVVIAIIAMCIGK